MIARREAAVLAGLAALPTAVLGAPLLAGRGPFWGDLLYIHFPWRVLTAQAAQSGRLPLWNPYNYLGMPLAAEMQCASWHPLTLPFHLAGFGPALAFFHAAHYALTAVLWHLALRRWGFSASAAAAGAAAAALGGVAVSRLPFLNHLTALSMLPAFLLFSGSVPLLALSLALSFLGGYPTMTAGGAAAAFALSAARRGRGAFPGQLRTWLAAGALAAAFSAVLLLPALELARGSRRGGGLGTEEALTWSFAPRDLVQLTAPPLIPRAEYDPAVNWWKTGYWGVLPLAAAAAGAGSLGPAAAAGAAAYAGGCVLLLLGGTNPVSESLWLALPPLRYVRYPGNMTYLLLPLGALLVASGLQRRRWAPWAALAIACELLVYAVRAHPTAPLALWTDAGPAVAALRENAGGARFLLSPRALHWQRADATRGMDAAAFDVKHRLYGLTNAPYRLEEVGGFGEPLVPRRQYAFMDFLFRRGAAEAPAWLPWAGARSVLSPSGLGAGRAFDAGPWRGNAFPQASLRAAWLPHEDGERLPSGLEEPPSPERARPLPLRRRSPARLSVSGDSEARGWLYLAEPLGPGWKAYPPEPSLEPALGAFWKKPVPAGRWTVSFRYEPLSFRLGLLATLASLLCAGLWYHARLKESAA